MATMGESGNPHTILAAKSCEEHPHGRWKMRQGDNIKIPIKIFVLRVEGDGTCSASCQMPNSGLCTVEL